MSVAVIQPDGCITILDNDAGSLGVGVFLKREPEQDQEIFRKEIETRARAHEVLRDPPQVHSQLLAEYECLSERFDKLLRQSQKLTRLADNAQNKLMRLKNQLQEQNEKINAQQQELVKKNRQLQEASLTDALTGLRNRRFLSNFLEKDVANRMRAHTDGQPLTEDRDLLFLMLDLDHFKRINDRYGHGAGDRVLVQISDLINRNCRKGDIPVRWGGEEFLMVCRDTDRKFGPMLAERLRTQVAEMTLEILRDVRLNITCSIGFAIFPFFQADPARLSWQQVVDMADQALYAAKNSRRNAWVGILAGDQPLDRLPNHDDLHLPELLLEQGQIQVLSSFDDGGTIRWN